MRCATGILGLDQLLDRFPQQLSNGQRPHVAMGCAIVRDLQVFLFDEPLSNLDAQLRIVMRDLPPDLLPPSIPIGSRKSGVARLIDLRGG